MDKWNIQMIAGICNPFSKLNIYVEGIFRIMFAMLNICSSCSIYDITGHYLR